MRVTNGSRVRIPHWQATVMYAVLEACESGDELLLRCMNLCGRRSIWLKR